MNAFSVGMRDDPVLGVSDGLLRQLSTRELIAVLAHEITHIRHNDMRVMASADLIGRLTGLFSTLGQFLLFINLPLVLLGRSPISWWAVILLLVAPTLSGLLQLALSRTREYDADVGAARLTGDPVGLANALGKMDCHGVSILRQIVFPGYRPPDPSLFRTHPRTKERIERLLEVSGLERSALERALAELASCPGELPPVAGQPRWHIKGL